MSGFDLWRQPAAVACLGCALPYGGLRKKVDGAEPYEVIDFSEKRAVPLGLCRRLRLRFLPGWPATPWFGLLLCRLSRNFLVGCIGLLSTALIYGGRSGFFCSRPPGPAGRCFFSRRRRIRRRCLRCDLNRMTALPFSSLLWLCPGRAGLRRGFSWRTPGPLPFWLVFLDRGFVCLIGRCLFHGMFRRRTLFRRVRDR